MPTLRQHQAAAPIWSDACHAGQHMQTPMQAERHLAIAQAAETAALGELQVSIPRYVLQLMLWELQPKCSYPAGVRSSCPW